MNNVMFGRVLLCSVVFLLLSSPERHFKFTKYSSFCLRCPITCLTFNWTNYLGLASEKQDLVGTSSSFVKQLEFVVCSSYTWPWILLSLQYWNVTVDTSNCASIVCRSRLRRHKCPTSYYANSCASFHQVLIGDLVYKLNPGPERQNIPTIVSTRQRNNAAVCMPNSRNSSNLIQAHCLPRNCLSSNLLSLCHMNAQSIRNKTTDFCDYVCDFKCDLVAITET